MTIENEREYKEALSEWEYMCSLPNIDPDVAARMHELNEALEEWEEKGRYQP